uniref:Uncharacterized protein LOC114332086 n=1 Tax=Diabrotica virgifera virgifera TaxID=50390 RepID=A0A6P7FS29_DIAVI
MRKVAFLLNILIVSVVSGGPAWKEVQRGGGLKIGSGAGKNSTSLRGNGFNSSGIKLGGSTRGIRTTTTSIPEEDHIFAPTVPTVKSGVTHLHVGIMVPYKSFGVREYNKAASSATSYVQRKLKFFKNHDIQVHLEMKEMTPSPTDL